MIFCGLLFEIFYNGANFYTTTRSDVGTWAFEWEQYIPFVPAMIVPYWTLNLFFMTSSVPRWLNCGFCDGESLWRSSSPAHVFCCSR